MGIALSATVRFFSPLSAAMAQLRPLVSPSVARYRMALPPASHGQHGPAPCNLRSMRPAAPQAPMPSIPPMPHLAARRLPLRVVRIVDTGHTPTSAGRMSISGSMADVCAELDRLVQAEATRH